MLPAPIPPDAKPLPDPEGPLTWSPSRLESFRTCPWRCGASTPPISAAGGRPPVPPPTSAPRPMPSLPASSPPSRRASIPGRDTLRGRLDLLVDGADERMILDWKTGFRVHDTTDDIQLAAYHWLATAIAPDDERPTRVTLGWLRHRHGWDTALLTSVDHVRNGHRLRTLVEDIRRRIALVQQGADAGEVFTPVPSSLCGSCHVAPLCLALRTARPDTAEDRPFWPAARGCAAGGRGPTGRRTPRARAGAQTRQGTSQSLGAGPRGRCGGR